jgi:hypothetical protein
MVFIINSNVPKVLILNDVCVIGPEFRHEFESQRGLREWLFINESFSHFLVSKNTIGEVGWFDERFLGIGHEDGDYARRCALAGYEYDVNIDCNGILNLQIPEENVGYTVNKNEKSGNYSMYIERFFLKKWKHTDYAKKGYTYIPIKHLKQYLGQPPDPNSYCKLRCGMKTPLFYPLDLLD